MIRGEDEAREVLGPYAERLRRCLVRAITDYYTGQDYAPVRLTHSKRTDASTVHDRAWENLRAEFDDEPAVVLHEKRSRRTMHFGQLFAMRIKKLDKDFRPRNNMTQRVLDFLEQVQQQPLPGIDPPTIVDLSYRLTGPAQIKPDVYIRCPRGRHSCHWIWELAEPTAALPPEGSQPQEPDEGGTGRRARPRQIEIAEEPGEEADDGPESG